MKNPAPKLVIPEEDYSKLCSLISSSSQGLAAELEEEISRAEVLPLPEVPKDRVVMHSTVTVADLDSGSETGLTLVYPHEAKNGSGQVSVLAPMGIALIGLRQGQEYEWTMPNGRKKRFLVKDVRRGA
jgi:regulator of nucleoside diphosphate kinase